MNELRERVREVIPVGFLRVCDSPEALWVSDAPRRQSPAERAACAERLTALGCTVSERDGLWLISPGDERLQACFGSVCAPCFPSDDGLLPIYELARLLSAHEAPWGDQPRAMLLALLKHGDTPTRLAKQCERTLAECAVLLRARRALPSAAANWLFSRLHTWNGKEESL